MGPDLYVPGDSEIGSIKKEFEQVNKNFMFILKEMKRMEQRLTALEEAGKQTSRKLIDL